METGHATDATPPWFEDRRAGANPTIPSGLTISYIGVRVAILLFQAG